MPALDRRIVVRVTVQGHNAFGEPAPVVTDHPQWAALVQDRLARNVEAGGVYALAGRVWRVRFNQCILDAHAAGNEVAVITGNPADEDEVDIVTGVGEPTPRGEVRRRRFLDLMS